MIELKRATPTYFASLARLLVCSSAATQDPFGRSYKDREMEIRATSDCSTIQMVADTRSMFRDAKENEVIFEFRNGEITLSPQHQAFTSTMEWSLSGAFKGEHLYVFGCTHPNTDTQTLRSQVIANSVRDAETAINKHDPDLKIVDLLEITDCPESESGIIISPAVRNAREIAAKIEESRDSDDSIYKFKYHDARDDRTRVKNALPIQAMSLSDAEATLRAEQPLATLKLIEVTVEPLFDFYSGRAKSHYPLPQVITSIGIKMMRG